MHQPGFGPRFEAFQLVSTISERSANLEGDIFELKRSLDEVNRKVDLLLDRSTANRGVDYHDVFAPSRIPIQNGLGLDDEFGWLSMSLLA